MAGFDPDAAALPGSGIYGIDTDPHDAGVIVIPVPFEATTSYGGGAAQGPEAVLAASHQVDLFDRDTGRPYEAGISLLDISPDVVAWNEEAKRLADPVIEAGGAIDPGSPAAAGIARVDEIGEAVNGWVYEQAHEWLGRDRLVVVLGGDHSVPFGSIRAHAEKYPGMGILHLDAHADLRKSYEGFEWSHASIFHNVVTKLEGVGRIVQVGLRDVGLAEARMIEQEDQLIAWFDSELAARKQGGEGWTSLADQIVNDLPEHVYLSWDIDGLDPTLCPGTGTPVPGGLSWHEAVALLSALVRSGRTIVGLDLCEVAPGTTEWDANVGARLLYKMIGNALLSRK